MKLFVPIILIILTSACASKVGKDGGYEGISAWSKYQEASSENKRAVKSAYPNSIKRYKIPEQHISSVDPETKAITREEPKVIRVSINNEKTITEIPQVAKDNMEKDREKIYLQEQYQSAAGSLCQRKRFEKEGDYLAQIVCKYPDGREYHVNDLTQ